MHEQQDFRPKQCDSPAPPRRRRLPAIDAGHALPAVVVAIALFAGILVARSNGAHHQAHVDVPIELRGWPGGPSGVTPVVRVSIGGGAPIPVLLDTGSTGLNILAGKLPPGSHVWPMGDEVTQGWGGGAVTRGRRALASVTIGGVATTAPVIIGMVESTGCAGGGSACLSWLGHAKVDGVLGIRLGSQPVTSNPLLALPAPYSQSWRIALSGLTGTLELGAPVPEHPLASFSTAAGSHAPGPTSVPGQTATVPQPEAPASEAPAPSSLSAYAPPSASPLANAADLPTLCWQVRGRSQRACVPTIFDTGSTDTALFSTSSAPPLHLLPAGVRVTGWSSATDPTPLWNLTSGTSASEDLVLTNGPGLALMDTGIAPFYSFDFTYDAAHARMYLTRTANGAGEPAWRHGAEALCRQGLTVAETQARPTPPEGQRATLPERTQAFIGYLTTWGRMSLRLDDAFARLRPPAALAPLWARAVASDRRASRMMLQYARVVPRLATTASFVHGADRFQKRYDPGRGRVGDDDEARQARRLLVSEHPG
ncbi:MAG: hypothetical protein ACRDPM_22845 [Solirubrobacteraceae bacterium]